MMAFSVGIFSYSTRPRGSVVHAACLAEALSRAGVNVTLHALSKAGDEFYRPLRCAVRLIPAEPAPTDPDALIRQRIAEFRAGLAGLGAGFAIWHAEDCLAGSALLARRSERGGMRVVRTVHHVEHFESEYLLACQRRSIEEADALLSVSEATRREVRENFGLDAPVVTNGVDLERFAEFRTEVQVELARRIGVQPGEPLIVSVGGVESRKNTLIALRAVALAFERHPTLRWVIAGGASIWEHEIYRAQFSAELAALPAQLRSRIHVLGTIPEQELTALYQLSDILLCPSTQEGFGLCVLEAQASGCVPVVSQGAPFDEYLDEQCARFVDPHSVTSVAAVLCGLLADAPLRARLVEAGRTRVACRSWDHVAAQHLVHYESLLRRATPTRSAHSPEFDHA